MKLSILASIIALLGVASAIAQPQKQVIVSYPDNTPDSVIEAAMSEIKAAGGFITHEYKIFKCVAASSMLLSLLITSMRPPLCQTTTNTSPGDSPQRPPRRHWRPSRLSAQPTTL